MSAKSETKLRQKFLMNDIIEDLQNFQNVLIGASTELSPSAFFSSGDEKVTKKFLLSSTSLNVNGLLEGGKKSFLRWKAVT